MSKNIQERKAVVRAQRDKIQSGQKGIRSLKARVGR